MQQAKLVRHLLALISIAVASPCVAAARPATAQPPAAPARITPDAARAQYKQLTKDYFTAAFMGEQANALKIATDMVALTGGSIGENSVEYAGSLYRLAESEKRVENYAASADHYRKGAAIFEAIAGPNDARTLNGRNGLAYDVERMGRYLEAEAIYRRVLTLRIKLLGDRDPATLESMNGLAYTLDTLDRYTESEPLLRKVLDLRIQILEKSDPDIGVSYDNLAYNLNKQGRFKEAEPYYEEAVDRYEVAFGPISGITLRAIRQQAMNLEAEGKYAEAEQALRNLVALGEGPLASAGLQQAEFMSDLAYTLDDEDKHQEAEQLYRKAREIEIGKLGADDRRIQVINGNLAYSLLSQPDRAYLALDPARSAAAGLERRYALTGRSPREDAQYLRDTASQKGDWLFLADADWADAQKMPQDLAANRAEAFRALQWAVQGTTSEAIALTAARRRVGQRNVQLGELAQERETLSSEWEKLDQDTTRALNDVTKSDAGKLDDMARQQTQIESRLGDIDRRLRKRAPAYYALTRPQPLDVTRARKLLAPDEAVLMIVPTLFGTHVLAITHAGIQWVRSSLTEFDTDASVTLLRKGLDPAQINDSGLQFSRRLAYHLYQSLIEPMLPSLVGKRHIFVAAEGALASLPFQVLVTAPPPGKDDDPQALRDTHWFGDAYALIQIPSLQSLQFLRTYRSSRSVHRGDSATFEGYGDPILAGKTELRGAGRGNPILPRAIAMRPTRNGASVADITMLRSLPSLPGTAQELDRIRQALNAAPSTIHIQADATETAVKSANLLPARILAFATHGLMAGDIAAVSEPGLVLTPPAVPSSTDDGILTASEITSLDLDADFVILSACNSASGNKAGEPPLSGLARAFFYAGARTLLVSHWPVYDDVAPRITTSLLKARHDNPKLSGAEALQQAVIAIRNDPNDSSLAFPSVWAPFVLVGDGAR